MSLEVLDGKVLENPPRPDYLSSLQDLSRASEPGNGRLTPTSKSLEEPQSDTSDHELGDTGPSSIEEQPRENLRQLVEIGKRCDVEMDPVSGQGSPRTGEHKKPADQEADALEPVISETITEIIEVISGSRKTLADPGALLLEGCSLLLVNRRHTDSVIPLVKRNARAEESRILSSNADVIIPTLLKSSITACNYSLRKSRTMTELNLQPRTSVADSEFARMRTSVKRRSTLRRRDYIDTEYVLFGNKIDEGHRNFVMAYNMLTGIRVAVSGCSGVMKLLTDTDFRTTRKLTFNTDGSELTPSSKYYFKFKDYCPKVFRELRSLFGIDPADYLMSITGKYILSELGSPGKSGSFFYYSRDFRFIIKTIHHSEHKQLRRILKSYYAHVKENPNTLISQFYGLHRLKVKGGMKKIHFIVMNNLFPPHRDIHLKYDLKGSTWGRYTRIDSGDDKKDISEYTLKDLNWLERKDKIYFGPEKRKTFFQQLEADVQLLKKINVMDYSLLLGVHDVKKGNSLATAKLSIYEPKSSRRAELIKTNPRDIDRGDLPSSVFPGRSKYIFYGHDGGIRATDETNEPLPEIYYLGIIDCLTNYSFRKRLETFWRSLSHSRNTISALPSKEYGNRFLAFIKAGIASSKVKRS